MQKLKDQYYLETTKIVLAHKQVMEQAETWTGES